MNRLRMIPAILMFFTITSHAQTILTGRISDIDTRKTVEFATLRLLTQDSAYINSCLTDSLGRFSMNINNSSGKYLLSVSCLGYKPVCQSLELKQDKAINIGLEKDMNVLGEVFVVGKKNPITNQGEKMIVNVDSYMNTSGKNSLDVLRVLPGITKERESLSLMGKTITVYINNKPSRMSGKELTDYLSTLQGSQIEDVELILNPGSEYDAGNSGSIVNIKLKKNKSGGLDGTFSNSVAAWGRNKYEMPSISLNCRRDRLKIHGKYSFLINKFENIIEYIRKYENIDPALLYKEKGELEGLTRYHSFNLGLDYSLSKRHEIGVLLQGINNNTNTPNNTRTTISKIDQSIVDSVIYSPIGKTLKLHNYQANINDHLQIDSIGSFLDIDINYMNINNKNTQFIPCYYYLSDYKTEYKDQNGNGQYVVQKMKLWSGKADLNKKIQKNTNLMLGLKYDAINRNNDLTAFTNTLGEWSEATSGKNIFDYDEHIYASYIKIDRKLSNYYLSAGIRWELTRQEGKQKVDNASFEKHYNDWFPSFSAQYNIDKTQNLSIGYNRKIMRPSFSMMNPFKFYTSPQTYQVGNTDLAPNYIHSLSLKYIKSRASVTLLYNSTKGEAVQEAFIDTDNPKVVGYRYVNWGSTDSYQISLYFPINVWRWWSVSLNGTSGYRKTSSLLNGDPFTKNYAFFNGSLYNSFVISHTISADLYASLNTSRWMTATLIKPSGYMSMSVTKELWQSKASITLGVDDPFRWSTFRSQYVYQNINEQAKEINNARMINLRFKYKFGSSKIKKNRNRNTGIEDVQQRL
ncbi:MAG: TonB-dependent receptor [Bacteroidetes bacterium]|nr:TonB-dependent receptor [Bacteroidota bacterium]